MKKIVKSKDDVIEGLGYIIKRYNQLKIKINKSSAYTKEETEERLKLLHERDILSNILYEHFDLQDHELDDEDNEIIIE